MDDVDELCRFWAASDCGEDDVCYGDCYDDGDAHGNVEGDGDSDGDADSVGDVGVRA